MFLETFLQDLRIGLRVLIKEKAFCALAVFILAIGIGGVATQFAVVNGVLLRGFSFRDADRLVDVQLVDPVDFTPTNFNGNVTTADFVDMKAQQTSFSEFVGYLNGSTVNLTYNGQPKRFQGGYITHDFFRALGVAPALGRDFLPEEDRAGVDKAILLSDALWRREFGGDPGIIGQAVRVNGRAGTIIGVMPPKFQFPANEDLWIPVNAEFPVRARNDRNINNISIIARLKVGVSIEQATTEVTAFARQFGETYPDTHKQFSLGYVRPLITAFTGGGIAAQLYAMLGLCAGVLLIACINVMNMQFARAALRGKELAIRSSLGATRVRLIRQMLTESLLVAGIGAVLGIGLAFWATDFLTAVMANLPQPPPSWMTFDVDGTVLGFVVAVTLFSALISGFVPAWMSSRTSANAALKEGGRGNTSRSIGIITRGLVVFQILITCVLLIAALLQVQSIVRQQNLDYGYDTSGVLGARLGLMEGDYPDSARRQLFYERLLRELRASPQFAAVSLTNRFRMVFSGNGPVEIEGRDYKSDTDRTDSQFENITSGHFATLGVRLLEGRDFTENDSDQNEPVAIVNAAFAKKYFPGVSALERRFRTTQQNGTNPGPWRKIVGVVSDVRMKGPFNTNDDDTGFYVPYFATAFGPVAPEPVAQQFGTIVVRPPQGQRAESLVTALQNIVNKVDPNLPLYFASTPKVALDGQLAGNRVIAMMFGLFGAVAVLLASVGLYGVMSFSVNQRRQEFGVRMALGAETSRILGMVFKQGVWQLGLGLAFGLGLSLAIARLGGTDLQNNLPEISPMDPFTYFAVAALISVVAMLATLVPARRATKVDPMIALRAE